MKQLCEMLTLTKEGVRKRATFCLGHFSIILSFKQLQQLMSVLVDRLQKSRGNKNDILIQIQCISQISRSVGNKLANNFNILFPILAEHAKSLDSDQSKDLENEISEAALSAIENLIRKCSNEAKDQSQRIVQLANDCLVYDPNY